MRSMRIGGLWHIWHGALQGRYTVASSDHGVSSAAIWRSISAGVRPGPARPQQVGYRPPHGGSFS